MIRSLRRRHRWMVGSLAVVVPIVLAAALIDRRPSDQMQRLPAALLREPVRLPRRLAESLGHIGQTRVTVRITAGPTPTAGLVLELDPLSALHVPEGLLYWSPGAGATDSLPPPESLLLGVLEGDRAQAFVLPAEAMGRDGFVVVYSLVRRHVEGRIGLSLSPGATGE